MASSRWLGELRSGAWKPSSGKDALGGGGGRTPTQGLDRLQSYRKELEDELEAVVTGWLSLRDFHHHANQRYRIVPDIQIGLEANRADALGAGRGVYAWMDRMDVLLL